MFGNTHVSQKLRQCHNCSLQGRKYWLGHKNPPSQSLRSCGNVAEEKHPSISSSPAYSGTHLDGRKAGLTSETKAVQRITPQKSGITREKLSVNLNTQKTKYRSLYKKSQSKRVNTEGQDWTEALGLFRSKHRHAAHSDADVDSSLEKKTAQNVENCPNRVPSSIQLFSEQTTTTLGVFLKKKVTFDQEFGENSKFLHKQFSHDYMAYLRALLVNGQLDEARESLNVFLLSTKNQHASFDSRQILEPAVHCLLMKEYAMRGMWDDGWSLLNSMYEAEIIPNLVTYTWLLYASISSNDHLKYRLGKTVDMMNAQGITHNLENILRSGTFSLYPKEGEQLRQVLAKYYPDIVIRPKKAANFKYDNELTSDINFEKGFDNTLVGIMSKEKAKEQLQKQIEVENQRFYLEKIENHHSPPDYRMANQKLEQLDERWRGEFRSALSRELASFNSKPNGRMSGHRVAALKLLRLMETEAVVDSVVSQALEWAKEGTLSELSLVISGRLLTSALHRSELTVAHKQDKYYEQLSEAYEKYSEACFQEKTWYSPHRQMYQQCDVDEVYNRNSANNPYWTLQIFKTIGNLLLNMFVHSLTLPPDFGSSLKPDGSDNAEQHGDADSSNVLAFYLAWAPNQHANHVGSYQLKTHPFLEQFVNERCYNTHTQMNSKSLPSLVPPIPWLKPDVGMFFRQSGRLVKQVEGSKVGTEEELAPLLDALNSLSSTAWKVNQYMYDNVVGLFYNGGDVKLKIPREPHSIRVEDLMIQQDESLYSDKMVQSLLRTKRAEAYSERCSYSLSLSVANYVKDKIFWFPSYLDFRGRVYAYSVFFSPTSDGPRRSLLHFAKGKPLGKRGLEWLKIHLVNQSGFMKRESNKDRLEYANDNMEKILQSAETPFEGEQWWQTFDDPWLGLAACQELKAAYDSGDPVNYISHLPIHQDGSCNGLQHYAAMGRDQLGGEAVNLTPSDKPRDTYSDFASFVDKLRMKDAAKGHVLARKLEGMITRKVVKQTVMTQVYGVTHYGAKLQIYKQLKALKPEHIDPQMLPQCATYIAGLLSNTMSSMFQSSTDIQSWLTLSAAKITDETDEPIEWKTPLGLTCTQDYWRQANQSRFLRVNKQKQRNSFPPNFIHSFDSTHMLLTALKCYQEGIVFSSVHDCYWTHACDVDRMNELCRDAFISIYKQPVLDNLSKYFIEKYVDHDTGDLFLSQLLSKVPAQGKLNLDDVKKSEYFFS